MTQEEKKILLKDLSARLPYGVIVRYHYKRGDNCIDEDRELDFDDVETLKYNNEHPQDDWCEISWKPYLRPMSSMTEVEKNDLIKIITEETSAFGKFVQEGHGLYRDGLHMFWKEKEFDWLNAKHFDYRGLIPMGLALEATEDMYKIGPTST